MGSLLFLNSIVLATFFFLAVSASDDTINLDLIFNCGQSGPYSLSARLIELDNVSDDEGEWYNAKCTKSQCNLNVVHKDDGDGLWNNEYEFDAEIVHTCTKSHKNETIKLEKDGNGFFVVPVGKDSKLNAVVDA